mmetsp:Transcript_1109/g.2705  ORF Transcript_1109/g.2705 Transcript_1109/m.2705 type:complete len:989 (+) Transcript_1109:2683-5649(+)
MAELLVELLRLTYRETDNVKRKQAEEALAKHSLTLHPFATTLISAMALVRQDEALLLSAVSYLANALKTQALTEESATDVARMVIQQIHVAEYTRAVKYKLADCLFLLLNYGGFGLLNQAAMTVFAGFESLTMETLGCCYILQPVVLKACENANYIPNVVEILKKVLQTGVSLLSCLSVGDSLEVGLTILKELSSVLARLMPLFKTSCLNVLAILIQSSHLIEFLVGTVNLRIEAFPLDFTRQPTNTLEIHLIESKNLSLCVLSDVTPFLPDNKAITLNSQVQQVVGVCVTTIEHLVENIDLELMINDDTLSSFACSVYNYIATCAKLPLFHDYIESLFQILLVKGVLPLMPIDEAEKSSFFDSPEAFVASYDSHESEGKHPKLWATLLLQSLCQHIDGALTFTVKFVAQSFRRALMNDSFENYSLLQEYSRARFLSNSPSATAEACLTILNSIVELIDGRQDLQQLMDMMLTEVDMQLVDDIVKARLCMYIKLHSNWLFRDDEEKFLKAVFMVLLYLDAQNKSVVTCAANCLNGLLVSKDAFDRLEDMIGEILQALVYQITKTSVVEVIDALQEVTLVYAEDLDHYLEPLLQALVCRIIQEQAVSMQKETIFIIKCWNILRALADNPGMKVKLDLVEQVLQPLVKGITDPKVISYDEDIVLLINSLITNRKSISPLCWEAFPYLKLVQDKYNGAFFHLLGTLTAYITYGADVLRESPEHLELMYEMSATCLFYKQKGKLNEFINNEGCLLLHLLVQTFPASSIVPMIMHQVYLRYKAGVVQNFMKQRLFGVVLLGFAFNANLTMTTLAENPSENNLLGFFLDEIIKNCGNLTHSYERKVGVLGLCSLLLQPAMPNEVVSRMASLLETAIAICGWQPKGKVKKLEDKVSSQVQRLKKLKESRMKAEEKDVCMLLDDFQTPIKELNELQILKNMLKTAYDSSPDNFKTLILSLNDGSRSQVEQLIQSQVIAVANKTDVRKVVKARRHPF